MARGTQIQKTVKSENTKRYIVASFLRLMEEKPWEKISVIEICREADMTRGTFYQYFSDIYDLLEQLEHSLLEDLKQRLQASPPKARFHYRPEEFLMKYDCSPPESFLIWFEFCKDHRDAMMALLDRKKGDSYFVKKLKVILEKNVEQLMERDGTPNDDLRAHFIKVFVELHLLAAQTWLEEGRNGEDGMDRYLSVEDIVNLLNTMRVGSAFLAYRNLNEAKLHTSTENVQI